VKAEDAHRPATQFAATAVNRTVSGLLRADLMVSITHLPASISLLLTVEEARQLAFVILRETDKLKPRKEA